MIAQSFSRTAMQVSVALALLFVAGPAPATSKDTGTLPMVPQASDLSAWGEVTELGGGWVHSAWYGTFNSWFYPWIVHEEHGYQWVLETEASEGAFYLYDMEMAWLFTGSAYYPDIYAFALDGGGTWLTYLEGSSQPRFLYRYDTAMWISIPADEIPAMSFADISPGKYLRGSPPDELGRWEDEGPQHEVTLTRGFAMQTTEVTNAQFAAIMNWALDQGLVTGSTTEIKNATGDPQALLILAEPDCQLSFQDGRLVVDTGKEDYPVIEVTWYGAMAYCHYLSLREELNPAVDLSDWSVDRDAAGYRLPTEAEWEYACRAGSSTAFYNGPITFLGIEPVDPNLNAVGWYEGNSQNPENDLIDGLGTHPVGLKEPNAWGLFDMHGNVWEWGSDFLAAYPDRSLTDPENPAFFSEERILRGGGFFDLSEGCRSAVRWGQLPETSENSFGFRPVRTLAP